MTMSKFMILYRAATNPAEQMANATPEQVEASGEAWRAWATRVGYAVVELGAPLAHTTHVGPGSSDKEGVCGFSVLEAGSAEEVETILVGHPHLAIQGNSVEVLEYIPVAGL
jgi:hypothetical protein